MACLEAPAGGRERQPLGCAGVRRGGARPRRSRLGLGTLGWYFALAERVSEGRRFLELALAATGDDAPVERRIEMLADLCYLATEELDLDAALAAGERALSLAAGAAAPSQLGLAQLTLALAARAFRRARNGPPRWRRTRSPRSRRRETTGASRRPA